MNALANRLERRRAHAIAGAHKLPGGYEIVGGHVVKRRFKTQGPTGAPSLAQLSQANLGARQQVLAISQPMIQQFFQTSASANIPGAIIVQQMQNVGLNTKITVEVTFTLTTPAGGETVHIAPFGLAQFFSNIQLTDLSNYQRVNTAGWHLYMLACLRRQQMYGAAYATDTPSQSGSNWPINSVPNNPQPTDTTVTYKMFFEIPLAYHEAMDLRGAIYAQVTSATWRLQLTVNPQLIVGSDIDPTLAMFQSSATQAAMASSVTSFTVQIYQHYLDQLPRQQNGAAVLPVLDLAYNYLLQNTFAPPFVSGQDLAIPYANFRDFMSTMLIFDNGGTLNTGTDINYFGIQTANLTFLEKYDPYFAANQTRLKIGDDPPPGTYIFDHRRKPINTNQYGNVQLVVNPNGVLAPGTTGLLGYEMLALQSQAINSGSLIGG